MEEARVKDTEAARTSGAAPSRVAWVDHARGVGIFYVVLGHELLGLRASGIIFNSPFLDSLASWIYSFHMHLFFLLGGLFAEHQADRPAGVFVRGKLANVAYPYLIWSVLQTLMQFGAHQYINSKVGVHQLLSITIRPITQFWFLYTLFLISLIWYALFRRGLRPLGIASAFAAAWATQRWLPNIPWWPLGAIRGYGIYYSLGSVINGRVGTERIGRAPTTALAMIVILGYGIIILAVWKAIDGILLVQLAVALSGSAASIALAVWLSRSVALDFVRVLGLYSLEIYVAHTIAAAGIRISLRNVFKIQNVPVHLVAGTVGGLVLPLLLVFLCQRYHVGFLFRFPSGPGRPRSTAAQPLADFTAAGAAGVKQDGPG